MKLTRFRVHNFRSIKDSDWINVNDITAFIGQNEAGKSNLCEALYILNPFVQSNYNINEDWPMDDWGGRNPKSVVCQVDFKLTDRAEIEELLKAVGLFAEPAESEGNPDAAGAVGLVMPEVLTLTVAKDYENKRRFVIEGARELDTAKAEVWAKTKLPKCVYIKDYEFPGSQVELNVLAQRLRDVGWNQLTPEEQTFVIVLQLANVNMDEFLKLGESPAGRTLRSFDKRQASSFLTQQFGKLWNQKKVRFDLDIDATTLNIFVEDAGLGMPVRLAKRSTGFRWYVAFAWKFTHATRGQYKNCILLLEEPGIHLHYAGHKDLLKVFEDLSATNTILYTTHVATMLDPAYPERVRIVEVENHHTNVVTGVVSSQRTPMMLIEARLGLTGDLSGLMGNRQTLIVEGGDDVVILQKLSGVLNRSGREGLSDRIYLWPAEGASKTPMYAGFIVGQKWDAGVLLDSDDEGEKARKKIDELYLKHLAVGQKFRVFMLGKAAGIQGVDIAIEDIFPPAFYLECVNAAYRTALTEADLPADGSAQITKRVDAALKKLGRTGLDKAIIIGELLRRFDDWDNIAKLPGDTAQRAETLFRNINAAFR